MGLVPVTVLTGFLGAGKTTLLNRILTGTHGQRVAVIENEYGEVGIDDALVVRSDEELFEMNNGCICCTVRGDLVRILGQLMRRRAKLDRVVIETTGLADPGPVAQTFLLDEQLKGAFALDGVVTVVDAAHALRHLDSNAQCKAQVAFADVVVVNKTDLVGEEALAALEGRLQGVNAVAKYWRAARGEVPLEAVLSVGGFDLNRALEVKPSFLDGGHGHDHAHDEGVRAVGLVHEGPLEAAKLEAWLRGLLLVWGGDIYRMKGVFDVEGMAERYVLQGVHSLVEGTTGRRWEHGEPRRSQMVLIGKGLSREALSVSLRACAARAA